jgi:hypothetical protein
VSLPIAKIIWAANDSSGAHWNHLHVEGIPRLIGWNTGEGEQPPARNPGMTDSVWAIYTALASRFGKPSYFLDTPKGDWTHMGWYNRRTIGGKTQWSQHAWSNAIDIGPYYGVREQQVFYDFLTGKEGEVFTPHEVEELQKLVRSLDEVGSNGTFAKYAVQHLRNHPKATTEDSHARSLAQKALDGLIRIKNSI